MLSSKLLNTMKSVKSIKGAGHDSFELLINTDSRSFKKGETFTALVGENFDGFNYLENVLKTGARAVVFKDQKDRETIVEGWVKSYPATSFIAVDDTLGFLQEMATTHIKNWRAAKSSRKIIGVTGSNGKTTHKEMIYSLLDKILPGKVLATKGNLNNHIGVPLTIFRLNEAHEVAIIEMGMNHAGEIKVLCDIARPEHGMITNIGAAHIEFLKSMDNIFEEKGTLYRSVLENAHGKGVFVVNADDTYLAKLEKSEGLSTYGEKNGDVKISIKNDRISFHMGVQDVLITNKNISEHHNLKNLAGTAIFAMNLFPDKIEEIEIAASAYTQPSMNRSQWIGNIFLDAYNANPSSMRVSLDSFVSIIKNKNISLNDCYFVLGDMNELGDFAREMHKEIAIHVKELGIRNISFLGRYRQFYLEGFPEPVSEYASKEEFHNEWKKIRTQYKFIFVKASRSLELETLINIV
jgi:UDP-N-acetylmuramoyl-tripeptide--D-alanyl-D-alanine ligase